MAEAPRRLVKATYAHKKGRISKASGFPNINASSPLQILDAHATTLIPTTEMTRRMLKRSRQSQIPVYQNQQEEEEREQIEQSKPNGSQARNSNDAAQSYSMVLNDLRPKSRNLKENSSSGFGKSMSSSRTFETSLSNRHSSPRRKSRKSKSNAKSRSNRQVLATKAISISSITNSQHEGTKNRSFGRTPLLDQESITGDPSIPSKGTRKSLPLQPASQRKSPSFLVKTFKRKFSLVDIPMHIASEPSPPALALANFSPAAISTPLPNLNISLATEHVFGAPELSNNSNSIPIISPAHNQQDSNSDIPQPRKTIHIPSNSIFSDSVDFTVFSSRAYHPPSSKDEARLAKNSSSLFDPQPPKKKQSISLEEVAFGPGLSSSAMAVSSCPQTQTQISTTDNSDTSAFLFPSLLSLRA